MTNREAVRTGFSVWLRFSFHFLHSFSHSSPLHVLVKYKRADRFFFLAHWNANRSHKTFVVWREREHFLSVVPFENFQFIECRRPFSSVQIFHVCEVLTFFHYFFARFFVTLYRFLIFGNATEALSMPDKNCMEIRSQTFSIGMQCAWYGMSLNRLLVRSLTRTMCCLFNRRLHGFCQWILFFDEIKNSLALWASVLWLWWPSLNGKLVSNIQNLCSSPPPKSNFAQYWLCALSFFMRNFGRQRIYKPCVSHSLFVSFYHAILLWSDFLLFRCCCRVLFLG